MKIDELKRAVNNIEIDEKMQKKITEETKQYEKAYSGRHQMHFQKKNAYGKVSKGNIPTFRIAVAGILCITVLFGIGIPVSAYVKSLVRERMEALSVEEVKEVVKIADTSNAEADSYSREYSEEEKERREQLYQQYIEGVFPQKSIPVVENKEEAENFEFCFFVSESRFYLPDRELTDEEILEIIDFERKRDFALEERYKEEFKEELSKQKEEEIKQIEEVKAAGGITETEAVEIATEKLTELFGINGENMELNHYFDASSPKEGGRADVPPYYCVNWSDLGNQEYYYFMLSASDGHIIELSYSSAEMVDKEGIDKEKVPERREALLKLAKTLLSEKMGDISYTEVYHYYFLHGAEKETGSISDFVFTNEQGKAYIVSYAWDGTFSRYQERDAAVYKDELKGRVEAHERASEIRGEEEKLKLVEYQFQTKPLHFQAK